MNNNLSIYAFSSAQKPELLYTVKGFGKLKYALLRISQNYNRRQKFSLTMDNLLRLQKQAPQIVKNQLEQFTLYNYPKCRTVYINTAVDNALLQQLGLAPEQKFDLLSRSQKLELMLAHKKKYLEALDEENDFLQKAMRCGVADAYEGFNKLGYELLLRYNGAKRQQAREELCILRRQQEYREVFCAEATRNQSLALEKYRECLHFDELKAVLRGYSFEQVRNFSMRLMADEVQCCFWRPKNEDKNLSIMERLLQEATEAKFDFSEARLQLAVQSGIWALQNGSRVYCRFAA